MPSGVGNSPASTNEGDDGGPGDDIPTRFKIALWMESSQQHEAERVACVSAARCTPIHTHPMEPCAQPSNKMRFNRAKRTPRPHRLLAWVGCAPPRNAIAFAFGCHGVDRPGYLCVRTAAKTPAAPRRLVSIPPPTDRMTEKYEENEKILALHQGMMWEAKVVKVDANGTPTLYLVHYQGWNKKYVGGWYRGSGGSSGGASNCIF